MQQAEHLSSVQRGSTKAAHSSLKSSPCLYSVFVWYIRVCVLAFFMNMVCYPEPGILLMTNSLRQHPQLSAMLIEFLCKVYMQV